MRSYRRLWIAIAVTTLQIASLQAEEPTWQAGIAKSCITPKKPMWMGGYASRTRPADSTLHDLWAKVLALQDANGNPGIIITADLNGFPKSTSDAILDQISRQWGLDRSRIMLTASHTHSGPLLHRFMQHVYPLDDRDLTFIESYTKQLESTITATVGEAMADLAPATLMSGQGITTFAVNRRNNRERDVPKLRQQHALKGPVDHSVPVLAIHGIDGTLRAAVFGYACHGTVLNSYGWSGDYAGVAQLAIERNHPKTTAMFWQGCGADQNPLPRRSVKLAEQYGQMLARAVEDVLHAPMKPIAPKLTTAFEFVTLDFDVAPSRQECEALKEKGGHLARYADIMLDKLDRGESPARSYEFPVQVWKLGNYQLWISLGGEVVVDYALRFKRQYGHDTWVTAYANDVMAYVPSRRVSQEGGAESGSFYVSGLPAKGWAGDIEERLAASVERLVQIVNK